MVVLRNACTLSDFNRLRRAVALRMFVRIHKRQICACVPAATYTSDVAEEYPVLFVSSPATQEPTALQRLVGEVCSPERVAGGVDDHCVRCGAEYFVQHARHWNDLAQAKGFTFFLRRCGPKGGSRPLHSLGAARWWPYCIRRR